jgi:hypothetical protein
VEGEGEVGGVGVQVQAEGWTRAALPGHIPVWGGPIRPVEEGRRVKRPVKTANDGDPVVDDYVVAMTMVHVVVRPVPMMIGIVVRTAVPMVLVAAMMPSAMVATTMSSSTTTTTAPSTAMMPSTALRAVVRALMRTSTATSTIPASKAAMVPAATTMAPTTQTATTVMPTAKATAVMMPTSKATAVMPTAQAAAAAVYHVVSNSARQASARRRRLESAGRSATLHERRYLHCHRGTYASERGGTRRDTRTNVFNARQPHGRNAQHATLTVRRQVDRIVHT